VSIPAKLHQYFEWFREENGRMHPQQTDATLQAKETGA
jgi:hypothetical protein